MKILTNIIKLMLGQARNQKIEGERWYGKTESQKPKTSILITLYVILLSIQSYAQVFPVQVTPQLVPPYSLKLSEYQTTASEKLFVNLLLTDTNESNRQVRLKMYIEGQGLNIETVDFPTGITPIILNGGINQRISNVDLRSYFNFSNLKGITYNQYNNTLPDGVYNFCYEVYDYFSGQQISQKSCASVYLILNDPPLLNVPGNDELVTATTPQNIIFNWTPRHINATNVQYEFTLKELWDTNIDPQAAFLTSPVLHQETTFATTLLYGPANVQLLDDKHYGWQVRAIVSDGISETSVFRNNGYSEVYSFNYQTDCTVPAFVISEAQNSETVKITWQTSSHLSYDIQYRKKGFGDDDWFTISAYNNEATIRNLEAETVYEFRVGGQCTLSGGYAYSNINEFTMPSEEETAYYNCGMLPSIELENQDPLPTLNAADVFTAGDFPIVVGEASGNNGTYSGWGYVTLPFLAKVNQAINVIDSLSEDENGEGGTNIGKYTRIRVEFSGININTDYQLTGGTVETSYDPDWKSVIGTDEIVDAVNNIIDTIGDLFKSQQEALDNYLETKDPKYLVEFNDHSITLQQEIDSLKEDEYITPEEVAAIEAVEDIDKIAATELTDEQVETYKQLNAQKAAVVTRIAEAVEARKNSANDPLKAKLISLSKETGTEHFAIKHCNDCTPENGHMDSSSKISYSFTAINADQTNITFNDQDPAGYMVITKDSNKCIALIYKKTNAPIDENLFNNLDQINPSDVQEGLWFIDLNNEAELNCSNKLTESPNLSVCNEVFLKTSSATDTTTTDSKYDFDFSSSQDYVTGIINKVKNCINDTYISDSEITTILQGLQNNSKPNQLNQFYQGGEIYELTNNQLTVKENPLTDEQVNDGEWTSESEEIFRFYNLVNGNKQLKAFGIKNTLSVRYEDKTNLKEIAKNIKQQTNSFLNTHNVKNLTDIPESKGIDLNINSSKNLFPDGDKIEVSNKGSFIKIAYDSYYLVKDLLQTAEINKNVYLTTPEEELTIHAPGIATGITEVGVEFVTDLTSLATMVHGFFTDEKTKEEVYNSFNNIKEQVSNDPAKVMPLATDVIIVATSGNTKEEWVSLKNDTNLDFGDKNHKISRGVLTSVKTAIAGYAFIQKLPDITTDLITAIKRLDLDNLLDNLDNASNITEQMLQAFVSKVDELGDLKTKFIDDLKKMPNMVEDFVKNPDLIEAWKFIKKSTGEGATKSISPQMIRIAKKYLNDNDFLKIIGKGDLEAGKTAFGQLIKKYAGKCDGCSGDGLAFLPDDPTEYFDKVVELTKKYKDKNGIEIFNEAKGAAYSQEGLWHGMQHLETLDPKKVKKLDAKFEAEGTICDNCRFDVQLEIEKVGDLKFIEYKAYLNPSSIPLKQFKEYLANINDLKELQYVFSKAKLGGDTTLALEKAKKGMQSILKNNAEDLWEINEDLFKKIKKIDSNEFLEDSEDLFDLLNSDKFSIDHEILNFVKIH